VEQIDDFSFLEDYQRRGGKRQRLKCFYLL